MNCHGRRKKIESYWVSSHFDHPGLASLCVARCSERCARRVPQLVLYPGVSQCGKLITAPRYKEHPVIMRELEDVCAFLDTDQRFL